MTDPREAEAREVLADVLGYREGSAQRVSFLADNMMPIVFPSDAIAAMLAFADRAADMRAAAALARAGGDGWRPIAELTDDDGYVLGWSYRDDRCIEREHFIGRRYDIRSDALLNEWSGKWRMVTHWKRLTTPAAPDAEGR